MQAVNQMNVQGRQTRQRMQEMERDKAEKGQWDTQGRTQAPVQLEGPPEGSRGHRGCGGMEGQERGVARHNPGRMPGTGAQAGRTRRRGQGQGETVRGRRESE